MGAGIEWMQSFVTDYRVYCLYNKSENNDLLKEHAQKGSFPANSIHEVANRIGRARANQIRLFCLAKDGVMVYRPTKIQ